MTVRASLSRKRRQRLVTAGIMPRWGSRLCFLHISADVGSMNLSRTSWSRDDARRQTRLVWNAWPVCHVIFPMCETSLPMQPQPASLYDAASPKRRSGTRTIVFAVGDSLASARGLNMIDRTKHHIHDD
ncbi:hypothetical protein AcW1_001335 [Taiwanofungus camphoratus]|nr:hypothetical protein AcW2_000134 [Antrodia cinnamomea]KAI0937326.1 hypothetical protein AcV5_005260 [Antrodia cinnamomea]KAI0962539.1 hypothetical protein AcV7_001362 [Antrodia cinnamomea]KAI0964539.1 hypothetical protein AcW1_001335 [Antrodia cinnamomea]